MDYLERMYQEPMFGSGNESAADVAYCGPTFGALGSTSSGPVLPEPDVQAPARAAPLARAREFGTSLLRDPYVQEGIALAVTAASVYVSCKMTRWLSRRRDTARARPASLRD
ncbi:hypothetical protein PCE31106_03231 [Pandoraea cepalis]|uniref:Uncharacterized protein n=1 Tax=Pandoraea cepalis TaxID=2508294 RepID=A0A5E4WIW5_9BURK|nr:hypothetical protein PCE31106_03231 [Pandoraea cepalis]